MGADVNPVHERDGGRCAVHGDQAQTVHHRVHGDRADMRSSGLLSVCGDGTTGGHGWIEAHPQAARERGWTVSRHHLAPLTEIPVWMEAGPYGRGWYLLDDDCGFTGWPGSVAIQELGLPDPPPAGGGS
jgi:hypothetical protein